MQRYIESNYKGKLFINLPNRNITLKYFLNDQNFNYWGRERRNKYA